MSFSGEDFHDLVRLLEERPEWRAELRRLILAEELADLPRQLAELRVITEQRFKELAEAQERTDGRLEALTEQTAKLAEAQERTDGRLEALTEQTAKLAEAQERTDGRLEALTEQTAKLAEAQERTDGRLEALTEQTAKLAEAQERTDGRLEALTEQTAKLAEAQERTDGRLEALTEQTAVLTERVATISDDVADLKGKSLEAEYRSKGPAYFNRVVKRSHVLSSEEIANRIETALDSGTLSDAEAQELYATDVVVSGKSRKDGAAVYLVVEVSWGVGRHDAERAVQRAELWSRLGTPALPVVAGKWVTPEAEYFCRYHPVWQVTNGGVVPPSAPADR